MNITKSFSLCALFIVFGYYYAAKFLQSDNEGQPRRKISRKLPAMNSLKDNEKRTKDKPCYRHYYSKILLVIVYNHPHYESIPLLKQFYQPVFPNIYFCGPNSRLNSSKNVHEFNIVRGIFGYECLTNAIRENHELGYEGYFYINDDVILNFWNLIKIKFDINKIWSFTTFKEPLNEKTPTHWYWWISPFGFEKVRNAVNQIESLSGRFPSYKRMYDTFRRNGNGSTYAYNGRSDIVYVPRQYAIQFQELSSIFRSEDVFLEIAIPTIARFLDLEKDIHKLHGHYIPGDVRKNDTRVTDSRHFWVTYLKNPNLLFIHPFKLQHRYENNRELNLLLMKHILIKRSRELACFQ